MFTLVDRYVSRLFWTYFLSALLVFSTIFTVIDFMSGFAKQTVPTAALLKYYGFFLPGVAYQMMPVACLLSTIFTLSTLHRSNELVALFSMGQSLLRVALPILFWVTFCSAAFFTFSDQVLPALTQKKNYVLFVEIRKQPSLYSTVKKNKIWYRSENVLFNIKTLNPERERAQGITLYYFDESWRLVQLITAAEARVKDQHWILRNGKVTLFASESSFPMTQTFEKKRVNLGQDLSDMSSLEASAEHLSLAELNRFIQRNKEAGLDTLRYEVDYHRKTSFPMAALVMSLFGIPFSVGKQRSGGAFYGIGLCLVLIFLYWVVYSSSLTLGKHGALEPWLAAWSSNIAFFLLGGIFLARTPY